MWAFYNTTLINMRLNKVIEERQKLGKSMRSNTQIKTPPKQDLETLAFCWDIWYPIFKLQYIFYRLYEDGHKKGSVIIQGLEEVQVRDKREVFKILEKGSIKRQTAETKMNANSSRSHTVFTVTVFVNQQSIDGQDMLKIGTGP